MKKLRPPLDKLAMSQVPWVRAGIKVYESSARAVAQLAAFSADHYHRDHVTSTATR